RSRPSTRYDLWCRAHDVRMVVGAVASGGSGRSVLGQNVGLCRASQQRLVDRRTLGEGIGQEEKDGVVVHQAVAKYEGDVVTFGDCPLAQSKRLRRQQIQRA